jgi:hypothetical protein
VIYDDCPLNPPRAIISGRFSINSTDSGVWSLLLLGGNFDYGARIQLNRNICKPLCGWKIS